MRTLYVSRGLPGSGKSTRVRRIVEELRARLETVIVCATDDYFITPCCSKYYFDLDKLAHAHSWCRQKCASAVGMAIQHVIIDNTNVTVRECRPYVELGLTHGYDVVFLEPETPWAFDIDELVTRNVHQVPRRGLELMLRRWVPNMTIEKALGLAPLPGEMTADETAADEATRRMSL